MPAETVLIPVVFPNPDLYPLHDSFVKELSGFEISLLGYWEVADGQPLDEARNEHETEAEAVLYDLAAQFSHEGVPTDIQLHFGRAGEEERDFQERVAEQTHASGILLSKSPTLLRRVLVAVRDERDKARLTDLVSTLNPETTLLIELYHAAESEEAVSQGEALVAEIREELHNRGFPDVELTTTVEVSDDPALSIAQHAGNHELVVMGETERPDIEDEVFGQTYEYVAEHTDLPILLGRASDSNE